MIRLVPRPLRAAALAWGYRLGGWPRRLLVFALVLAGTVSALSHAHRPAGAAADSGLVLVAAHTLPAGARISAADVRTVRWPRSVVPDGALDRTAALSGQHTAGAIGRGEAITRTRLRGAGLTSGLAPGTVAVAVALGSSAAAGFLHAGDRVDLVRGSPDASTSGTSTAGSSATSSARGAAVVARDVPILDVAHEQDVVSLLVAVDSRQALEIAANTAPIIATLRPPN